MQSNRKHLLGLEGIPKEEIQAILDSALSFKKILERPIPKVPALRGITVVNLFYEPSTRTRISFELAEKRLSSDTVNFSSAISSVKKGETLKGLMLFIEDKFNFLAIFYTLQLSMPVMALMNIRPRVCWIC